MCVAHWAGAGGEGVGEAGGGQRLGKTVPPAGVNLRVHGTQSAPTIRLVPH